MVKSIMDSTVSVVTSAAREQTMKFVVGVSKNTCIYDLIMLKFYIHSLLVYVNSTELKIDWITHFPISLKPGSPHWKVPLDTKK